MVHIFKNTYKSNFSNIYLMQLYLSFTLTVEISKENLFTIFPFTSYNAITVSRNYLAVICSVFISIVFIFNLGQINITQIIVCTRLENSNRLENSLQKGKTLLSTYENKLAREEVAPADISALDRTQRELAVSL